MNQLEILRESLGQCDEILLDALLMRNRIGRADGCGSLISVSALHMGKNGIE